MDILQTSVIRYSKIFEQNGVATCLWYFGKHWLRNTPVGTLWPSSDIRPGNIIQLNGGVGKSSHVWLPKGKSSAVSIQIRSFPFHFILVKNGSPLSWMIIVPNESWDEITHWGLMIINPHYCPQLSCQWVSYPPWVIVGMTNPPTGKKPVGPLEKSRGRLRLGWPAAAARRVPMLGTKYPLIV